MLPAFIHCPTSTAGLVITGLQCLNLGAAFNEMQSPTPYSKFAQNVEGSTIPSQQGMLLIYVPATLTSLAFLTKSAVVPMLNGRELIVATLLAVHFAKRVAEVLYVHDYSGQCSKPTATFIGVFYALISLLILVQQSAVPASIYAGCGPLMAAGLAAFAVGEAGNLYHHALLASMRKTSPATATDVPPTPASSEALGATRSQATVAPSKAYVMPSGGLFDLVTMPHYTFEIVAWIGIALVCQQLNAFLAAAGMASYLAGRSVATTAWYRERFGDKWPSARRHLVPFIF